MASKRNRIIEIKNYLESCGVTINIGKNKAQGHTGFFKASKNTYRIDIAKGLAEDDILKALAHEFAHFLHYSYDKTLKSLDFVFPNTDEYIEELIKITVENIPKNNAKQLFDIKDNIQNEIQQISLKIKNIYPDFKENKDYSLLEEK